MTEELSSRTANDWLPKPRILAPDRNRAWPSTTQGWELEYP